MMLKYSLHFLYLIYVANGCKATTSEMGEFELRDVFPPVQPPAIAVLQNQSGSLIIKLTGDINLKKEYGQSYKYRIFYKKENDEFKKYMDVLSANTHVVIRDLEPGVKYCVKMHYIIYLKYVKGISPSKVECAVVKEKEESRLNRIALVTAGTVISVVLLVLGCMWVALKNYPKLKRALRPPFDIPDHFRKFFEEVGHIPWSSFSPSPDAEDAWDNIHEVTNDSSEDKTGNLSPKTHFYLERPRIQ
ncbi:hypothetical protein GN956_G24298 [Arapaima gigas]|nr:interferon gamma receptor 2-1 [Arapaima gigas]